jgi:sec-independent protein translocase protein TatC
VLTLFFAFGIAFEIPIATILLVWVGITTPESLASKRPYIIVGVFVIGMLLTPPDIISQTLLALPMWILFELGIILSRMFLRQREARERAEAQGEAAYAGAPVAAGSSGTQATKKNPHEQAEPVVGADISGGPPYDEERFVPMTDEEMEAELDAIESQEEGSGAQADDPIERKLRRVQALRDQADHAAARKLLYEVLEAGDDAQRRVARNILTQLDSS